MILGEGEVQVCTLGGQVPGLQEARNIPGLPFEAPGSRSQE